MTSNKELEARLNAMADDFHLPGGGRKKLSKLVAEHYAWFEAAARRGMSWPDMIRALTAAGVTGRDGKPLSVGTLSSTVWRKRAETEGEMGRPAGSATSIPPRAKSGKEVRPGPAKAAEQKRSAVSSHTTKNAGDRGRMTGSAKPAEGAGRRANEDVLAFMNRARSVRRKSE
ncbi:MAG: hypothetical protein E6614_00630 [Bradyrhizobium sp.]|jgi:hypothetical protein|uniref:Uncharacterized protein n=1 Tax=Bradyrhizobium campsiandrae TaxID=1729892 RepID=A0ABR7UJV6_9BRAD|nr:MULTISPECIES: hypothetical protein [Bradyrhizobium]MBC9879978.1 hypothetical protein [Bradyrhizobium campsiandrae]MBC9984127.1 hypothetical protein [Bradyrhizobium campsiandrae]MBR1090525.1 hypothetical protein [Bradyrhizobium manausense]MDU1497718.1 hypothetical protein [Bradyrhizobium sp.]MDU1547987.1 hypothetical protein [Bradyrhizobium sp.]